MLKPRLTKVVEEVFGAGGNHDLATDMTCREKLLDFLREEDHLILPLDDANFMLARDMIHFIDADNVYAETTSSKEAFPYMKLFLERMMASEFETWHYYDLKLLIASIQFTESFEQARQLASRAKKRIIQFKHVRPTESLQGYLALNMCARILNAKHVDDDEPATSQFED